MYPSDTVLTRDFLVLNAGGLPSAHLGVWGPFRPLRSLRSFGCDLAVPILVGGCQRTSWV